MYALIGIESDGTEKFWAGDAFHSSINAALVYIGVSLESMRTSKGKLQQQYTDRDIQIVEVSRGYETIEDGPIGGLPLDAYPGASLFALEQLYTDFPGPFFTGTETDITTLQGTIYNAKPWDGIVSVSDEKLSSTDEWTYLKSIGPVELSANRMVVGVLSVKGNFPDDNSRGMVELKGRLLFQVNGLNEIEVYAPRSDGQFGGVNLGSIPGDDEFFLIAFLVETNSLRCWINNQLVLNQFVDNIISADGPLEVSLRGVEWKMLSTWDSGFIPENPETLILSLMNHYSIS